MSAAGACGCLCRALGLKILPFCNEMITFLLEGLDVRSLIIPISLNVASVLNFLNNS